MEDILLPTYNISHLSKYEIDYLKKLRLLKLKYIISFKHNFSISQIMQLMNTFRRNILNYKEKLLSDFKFLNILERNVKRKLKTRTKVKKQQITNKIKPLFNINQNNKKIIRHKVYQSFNLNKKMYIIDI